MPPKYEALEVLSKIGLVLMFCLLIWIGYGIVDWLFMPDTEIIRLENPITNQNPTRIEVENGKTSYIYEKTTPSLLGRIFQSDDE